MPGTGCFYNTTIGRLTTAQACMDSLSFTLLHICRSTRIAYVAWYVINANVDIHVIAYVALHVINAYVDMHLIAFVAFHDDYVHIDMHFIAICCFALYY